MSRFDASVPRSMAPWDVPGDLWFTCGAARKKGHDPPCMRVWEGPPFRYDLFSVFVLFDRAHSRRRLREGGSRERKCLTDGRGEKIRSILKNRFRSRFGHVIFEGIEEVGIVIMDLPIAKLNISSRYVESLGIYGSDNSNWSNGEDLLARHVRSCTSKSC